MVSGYYMIKNGEQKGPFTFDEIIAAGIKIDTKVLSPKAITWENACDHPEFDSYFVSIGIYFPSKSNLASFWQRLLAYAIDFVIAELSVIFVLNEFALAGIINSRSVIDMFAALVLFHTLLIVYNAFCESTGMKGSLGKRICKLAVVDIDGGGITFGWGIKRGCWKILSRMIFYIGFLRVFWNDHRQAWHDELAKTYVVKRK